MYAHSIHHHDSRCTLVFPLADFFLSSSFKLPLEKYETALPFSHKLHLIMSHHTAVMHRLLLLIT